MVELNSAGEHAAGVRRPAAASYYPKARTPVGLAAPALAAPALAGLAERVGEAAPREAIQSEATATVQSGYRPAEPAQLAQPAQRVQPAALAACQSAAPPT